MQTNQPTAENILAFIIESLTDKGCDNFGEISLSTPINNDFIDSLELMELGVDIDRKFGTDITDKEISSWDTVSDIVNTVLKQTHQQPQQ